MDVQRIRRHNLCRLVSTLERSGADRATEQAQLMGNLFTGRKLSLLVMSSPIGALIARGLEGSVGLARFWMDREHDGEPLPSLALDRMRRTAFLKAPANLRIPIVGAARQHDR